MDIVLKYKLLDLIDDIKEVDAMINLHSSDQSAMMLDQYKFKKNKLVSYLIDELVNPELRSEKSIFIIQMVIKKFYPNLKDDAQSDMSNEYLNELEAVLAYFNSTL